MKTVDEYQAMIDDAQAKIKEIQEKCSHPSYEVMFYSWRVGAMTPSRICKECQARISDADEEESKKLWSEFYKVSSFVESKVK